MNSNFEITPGRWIWTHISDVRETEDKIFLIVPTPLGESVFPYSLSHNTDSRFWRLVQAAGGSLVDLRGMDLCIRMRSGYHDLYVRKDLRYCSRKDHPHYEKFNLRRSKQPINSFNMDDNALLIDGPSDPEPVGVDREYIWNLGIVPYDRFSEKDQPVKEEDRTKNEDDSSSDSGIWQMLAL